jgi:hypothetical protein
MRGEPINNPYINSYLLYCTSITTQNGLCIHIVLRLSPHIPPGTQHTDRQASFGTLHTLDAYYLITQQRTSSVSCGWCVLVHVYIQYTQYTHFRQSFILTHTHACIHYSLFIHIHSRLRATTPRHDDPTRRYNR